MKTVILALCLVCTGCAQLGDMWFNPQDPCQARGRANYQYPNWCGASGSGAVVTRGYYSNRPIYSTQYEKY